VNETQASYPQDRCVHQLFEAQAAAHPAHWRRDLVKPRSVMKNWIGAQTNWRT